MLQQYTQHNFSSENSEINCIFVSHWRIRVNIWMALRQENINLVVANDAGKGKTKMIEMHNYILLTTGRILDILKWSTASLIQQSLYNMWAST